MADNIVLPFALSLPEGEWQVQCIRSWFDKLTTNGKAVVRHMGKLLND